MTFATTLAFGDLLKQLRKRAGMTQGDLAAALGYGKCCPTASSFLANCNWKF